MTKPADVVEFAKRVIQDPKRAAEDAEKAAKTLEGAEMPGEFAGGAELPPLPMGIGSASAERLPEYLRAGARAMDKIKKGDTNLSPDEQFGVEAIVLLFGRPALLVQDDDFAPPPPEWKAKLEAKRPAIRAALKSVGRIELAGHPTYPWVGTGFLVAPDVIMTNRHVAVVFATQSNGGYSFLPGVSASVDYKEEYQRPASNVFSVREVIGIHPTYDLALLRIEEKGTGQRPTPLRFKASAPKALKDHDVVTIGYPAYDSRNDPTEMIRIFESIFNVKRLQPGWLTGISAQPGGDVIGHDCSTLGGNSGSAVMDLESDSVVGLHFGGRYLKGNQAVPLWYLRKDPLLTKAGIDWV